jgi:hypothetical protein
LTFRFIAEQRGDCPVAWACAALEVSESGYHAWAAREPSRAERRRGELLAAIEQVHAEVKGRYGSPRMAAELNARGHDCAENTVATLMKTHGIRAKAPRSFVRTTDSRHGLPVAANVLGRDFAPPGPNGAWSADITYIPTADGWLYLAVVEDLFSRMIVGCPPQATIPDKRVSQAAVGGLALRGTDGSSTMDKPCNESRAVPDRFGAVSPEELDRIDGGEVQTSMSWMRTGSVSEWVQSFVGEATARYDSLKRQYG